MSRPAPATGLRPSQAVRDAFGVVTDPVLLDGGQRRTWRAGAVVLKPVDDPVEERVWLCETYDAWPAADVVRVPRPLRTTDGAWSAHGWSAHRWLEGETGITRDRRPGHGGARSPAARQLGCAGDPR